MHGGLVLEWQHVSALDPKLVFAKECWITLLDLLNNRSDIFLAKQIHAVALLEFES